MPALRFGAPLLPFVAIAAAAGGARLARSTRGSSIGLAILLGVLAVHHVTVLGQRYLPRLPALVDPHAYERRVFPDQVSLQEMVSLGDGVVAIPKGAVLWMPRPVYVLHWERNGEPPRERR
jgi:hypothetical protein